MKKFMSLILVMAILFTLYSCGKKDPIEDEELVSKLENAIQSETIGDFLFSGVSVPIPNIHELEEVEEGKYDASGEICLIMKNGGGEEYVAFTAVMVINDDGEVDFESIELDGWD